MIVHKIVLKVFVFPDSVPEFILANGFKQVIDAVIIKCLSQVFVICRNKNDRAGNINRLKNIE